MEDDGGSSGLDGGMTDGFTFHANTVDAIDGFPSHLPSNDPQETSLQLKLKVQMVLMEHRS